MSLQTIFWGIGSEWIPIGYNDSSFSGTFDGNGYTIQDLYLNADFSGGLFYELSGTLKNLIISNVYTTNGVIAIYLNGGIVEGVAVVNGNAYDSLIHADAGGLLLVYENLLPQLVSVPLTPSS